MGLSFFCYPYFRTSPHGFVSHKFHTLLVKGLVLPLMNPVHSQKQCGTFCNFMISSVNFIENKHLWYEQFTKLLNFFNLVRMYWVKLLWYYNQVKLLNRISQWASVNDALKPLWSILSYNSSLEVTLSAAGMLLLVSSINICPVCNVWYL